MDEQILKNLSMGPETRVPDWYWAPEERAEVAGKDFRVVPGIGRTRDSDSGDLLDLANFESARESLLALDPVDARVARIGDWGCGWYEGLIVNVRNERVMQEVYDLLGALAHYPVLDDRRLSELEHERDEESWRTWARWELARVVERSDGWDCLQDADGFFDPTPSQEEILHDLVVRLLGENPGSLCERELLETLEEARPRLACR